MPQFIVNRNAQPTGEHEVHNLGQANGCLPLPSNRIDLGNHLTCHNAIAEARRRLPGRSVDGCFHCANSCHTR